MKQTVFFDMDNVLVDFQSGIDKLDEVTKLEYAGRLDEVPCIFSLMSPMDGAVDSVNRIAEKYDTFVLSTAPWSNQSAWTDKIKWIQHYFGSDEKSVFFKRVTITHQKGNVKGDFLIDDRKKWGADLFDGEFLHFGSKRFPTWESVTEYLLSNEHEVSWKDVIHLIRNKHSMTEEEKKQKVSEVFNKRVVTEYSDVVGIRDYVSGITNGDCVDLANLFLNYIPRELLQETGDAERYGYERGAAYAAARKLRYPILRASDAFTRFRQEFTGR